MERYPEQYLDFLLPGMFEGLGQYAFSIDLLKKKTGELKQMSNSFNRVMLKYLSNFINMFQKGQITFAAYDVTLGVSGILSFLLDAIEKEEKTSENQKIICDTLKYLVWLTEDYKYKNWTVPRFHIQPNQQYLDEEKKYMPNGHINLGMAHGIIGILLVLLKAKRRGYIVVNQEKAIQKIFDIYDRFKIYDKGILKYPRRLSVENYINGTVSDLTINSGWCYGNLGIVRGLMKASKEMEDMRCYWYYQNELLKVINQPFEEYNLTSPILCHGYASILVIQMMAWRESGNICFLETFERNINKILERSKKRFSNYDLSQNDLSLLNGNGGIILTLLEAISEKDIMNFEQLMFID